MLDIGSLVVVGRIRVALELRVGLDELRRRV